jgi:hypothetical protein
MMGRTIDAARTNLGGLRLCTTCYNSIAKRRTLIKVRRFTL